MKYVSKTSDLKKGLKKAFKTSAHALGREVTFWITSADWPSGQDIVDTGQLRASQQLDFTGDFSAQFSWNTEYAAPVFLGATLNNGITITARNAPMRGVKSFQAKDVFGRLAKGVLG